MINQSQLSGYVLSSNGMPVKSLSFIPSSDNSYIGVYAQYGNNPEWVPLNIGLPSVPGLQQVRDMNRNISMNEGSYEDAHFYLRSAAGNNVTTAFYTNADGGAIQSGDTDGYTALNLQPSGGLLTYGGDEVATKNWTNAQGFLKTIAGTANRITVSGNTINIATNYAGQNTITTLGTVTTGTWNGSAVGIAYGGTGQTSIGTNGQTLRSNGTSWVMTDALTYGGVIPASTNLNTYQTTGIYIQGSNANAASGTNYPIALAGKLEVVFFDGGGSNQFIWQTYHVYQGSDRSIYKREYYVGTWSAWVKILDANTATLQQVTTAGNSTTNNIALTGGTNGSSLLIDAVNSNYTIRAASSTGWARGLVAYNNAGTTILNSIGFNGSNGTTFVNGYIGLAYNNAIFKWTNSSVGVGFTSTNLPTQLFHVTGGDGVATTASIIRAEQNSGYVSLQSASATAGIMTPMVLGKPGNQTGYGLILRGTGSATSGFSTAAVQISGTNQNDNGATTSGNIFSVNNYTTNLLTLDYLGNLTLPTYGGLQGTSMITVNNSGAINRRVCRISSTNSAAIANQYGKIATITLPNQFNDANIVIDASIIGAGTGSQGNSKILVRAKQQAAFGNDPLIEMVQFNHNSVTPTSYYQFWYVIVQNTPTTIVDIYVKIAGTFVTVESNIWDTGSSGIITYYNQAALSASITGIGTPIQFTQNVYGTQDWVTTNFIKQNGNDFGSTNAMVIGTINSGQISFKTNNVIVSAISTNGYYVGSGIYNGTSINNSQISTTSSGTIITRNVADTNPALTVNSQSGTSSIQLWQQAGGAVAAISNNGYYIGAGAANITTSANAKIELNTSGTLISSNKANADSVLIINNINTSSTGHLTSWQVNGVQRAKINVGGNGIFTKIGINSTITDPTYLLDVNAGTLSSQASLGRFSQNSGYISIENGTVNPSNFNPLIKGVVNGVSDIGLMILGQGSNSFSTGAIVLGGRNSGGNGTITGNVLKVQNYTTDVLTVDYLGNTGIGGSLVVGSSSTTITPFNASATAFASVTPRIGVLTGTATGTYQDGILIRHASQANTAVLRETGLFIKLSDESSAGESGKGGAITMKSSNAFANTPDMNFYILNDANPKMTIFNNGRVGISILAGTGTRAVAVDSTGLLIEATLGTVTNVTGTANRITVSSGGTTPVIDIAATYAGQVSITTLGTISTGTWNATTIGVNKGGTGATTLTGVVIGNDTSAMTAVTGTANQLLRRNAANTAYEFFTAPYLTSTPTLQQVATAGNSYTGDLLLGISGSELYVGSTAIGDGNTRLGRSTLNALTSGSWNTAIGSEALKNLTTGVNNTSVGEISLLDLISGSNNTAIGDSAGIGVTGGDNNIYFGLAAGLVGSGNRARGNINIFIGRGAGSYNIPGSTTLGSYNIALGLNAGQSKTDASNQLFIGNYDPVLFPQHLIEGVMGAAQTLKLNADVTISTLAGTGTGVVVADASGTLSTQSILNQWEDFYGYTYLAPNSSLSSMGVDTNGGYASRDIEISNNSFDIPENVEFLYRTKNNGIPYYLNLPDPAQYKERVLTVRNACTDPASSIKLNAYPVYIDLDSSYTINELFGLDSYPQNNWIRIKSVLSAYTSSYVWLIMEGGAIIK